MQSTGACSRNNRCKQGDCVKSEHITAASSRSQPTLAPLLAFFSNTSFHDLEAPIFMTIHPNLITSQPSSFLEP